MSKKHIITIKPVYSGSVNWKNAKKYRPLVTEMQVCTSFKEAFDDDYFFVGDKDHSVLLENAGKLYLAQRRMNFIEEDYGYLGVEFTHCPFCGTEIDIRVLQVETS